MTTLTCIVCPRGCTINIEKNAGGGFDVTGNTCQRGHDFAVSEMTAPMRTICSTVKTGFPVEPVDRYSTRTVPPDKYFPEWTLWATPRQPAESEEFLAAMQIQRLGNGAHPAASIDTCPAEGGRAITAADWLNARRDLAGA